MDELTEVSTAEENNRQRSMQVLGDTVSLVQDLCDAHSKLVDLVEAAPASDIKVGTIAGSLFMGVRYELVTGALSLLRGHITDSMQILRRAVEMAAFAYRIHADPTLADLWIKGENDEQSFKRYRKKFSAKKLFPKEHPILSALYERYSHCSKAVHSSLASLARRSSIEETDDKVLVNHDYFELKEEDKSEPARAFLFMIDAHYGILRLFTEVFEKQLAPSRNQWDIRMTSVAAKLEGNKLRWKPIILADRGTGSEAPTGGDGSA